MLRARHMPFVIDDASRVVWLECFDKVLADAPEKYNFPAQHIEATNYQLPIMTNLLNNLNDAQVEAVQTINGPVLVLAGPGSGKTRVLTRRVAYMIQLCQVAPWNILAVTFTNKAAREMRERVEELIGVQFESPEPGKQSRLGGLTIGTYHSLCARLLRIETAAIGYERNWVIYDTADQRALIRGLLQEMNYDEKRYSPNAIKAHISRQKNELILPENHQSSSYFEEIAGRVYTRYQEALQLNNAMDFDDLLMRTTLLLQDNEILRTKYQQKWRYLLIDEFQDTNAAQYALMRCLAEGPETNRNLFCVGDADQAIYRFRVPPTLSRRQNDSAGAELSQHPEHSRCCQRGHQQQPQPHTQEPLH